MILSQKEQSNSALQCYIQALKIDRDHLPSIFNLACNYEKLNKLESAKEQFLHAIQVNPKWQEALFGIGLVCIKLKQYAEAVTYLNRALLVKEDQNIRYLLALAYKNDGDFKDSLSIFVPIFPTE